jgi:hypothetical protein
MTEALSVEDFATQLTQAEQPEQPEKDSEPAAQDASEEGKPDDVPEPEAQAEGEEQQEQPETESEQIIKWQTANGESFEVPVKELQNGYMRQAHFTRSMQEVSQERVQAQSEIRQQVEIVQALADGLGEFKAITNQVQQYAAIDWQALSREDPAAAQQHWITYQQLKEKAAATESQVKQARQQFEQTQTQVFAQNVAKAEVHLSEKVPNVTRDEVLRAFGALQRSGADQRVIDMVRSTPALAEAMIYAARWQDLQSKKPQIANKVKALPPVSTKARQSAPPPSRLEVAAKAAQSKRAFSVNEFAQLLKDTR